ncbi:MAG: AI-2E family transporter [Nitrospiraceae bacterium]|nr:AI-2E family transporter [Nitrospiraceae bacterium]
MVEPVRPKNSSYDIAAWIIAAVALLMVLRLHLLPALLSGLLVYELVHILAPLILIRRTSGNRAKLVAVALLAVAIVASLVFLIWVAVHFFRSGAESLPALLKKMAEIIEGSRENLPQWVADYLPGDAEEFKNRVAGWLHAHAGEVEVVGKEAGRAAAHILVGLVIGALVSLREAAPTHKYRPLAAALAGQAARLSRAFRSVVFAQVRISALNTIFAWLYLGVLLPLLGVHLPLVKTMIAITFVVGLIPVVGNLVSNSIITVVSLSHSPAVAFGSLLFLVIIHKLEYFLNARIIGSRISAHAWELLLAMLVMEAAFGIPGVVAAPVYYAYVKDELVDRGLV